VRSSVNVGGSAKRESSDEETKNQSEDEETKGADEGTKGEDEGTKGDHRFFALFLYLSASCLIQK